MKTLHQTIQNSPVVLAGARSILEMVKTIPVSHDNLSVEDLRYQFGIIMAVLAYSQVLHNPNFLAFWQRDQPKGKCQLLTMQGDGALFLLFLNIKQHLFGVGGIPLQSQPPTHLCKHHLDLLVRVTCLQQRTRVSSHQPRWHSNQAPSSLPWPS